MGGFAIQVSESILHQLVQRRWGAVLVHAVGLAVQGEVDFHCAMGGAQVAWPNMKTSDESESSRAAEDNNSPCGFI